MRVPEQRRGEIMVDNGVDNGVDWLSLQDEPKRLRKDFTYWARHYAPCADAV